MLGLLLLPAAPLGALAQTGLQFDGTNDYVTFGQATSTLGAKTFTIETWFKRSGTGAVTSTGSGANAANGLVNVVPLLAKGRGEADGTTVDCNYFLGIQNTPNVVLVADYEDVSASNNNHALTGTTVIQNNVWYHAAATYDGVTFRLYLNGNLEASAATTAQPRFDSIQHASLGTAINSTAIAAGFFLGVIDEARVWDHARPQAGIRDSARIEITSSPGLLGRWGLNDGSGTSATNSVGGSPNGTLTNFAVSPSPWVTGGPFAYAYGVLLNGTSGYATFGDPAALDLASFTIETWFRRDGAGTTTSTGTGGVPDALPLVTHGAPEAEGSTVDMNFFLGLKSTGVLCADFEEGAGGAAPGQNHPVVGTTAVTNGTWHHAAATYDGTSWKLYLDGLLEATAAIGQPVQSSTIQHAALGTALTSAGATNGFFNGVLDEARVWSGARSQATIQATINSQLTSPTAGLVARWGLDEGAGRVVRDTSGSAVHGTLNPAPPSSAWGWVDGSPFNVTITLPAAPTGLTATAITHAQVDLAWTDNATTESGFEIERSTTGIGGTYSPLATVPANTQAFSDLAVTVATEYCYRVRAVSGAGASGYAGPACAMTPASSATALDFGGSTYGSFGDPAALRLSQFTIEMWLRRDGAGVGTDTGTNGIPDAIPLLTKGRAEAEDPVKDINYFVGIKAGTGVLCADFEEAAGGGTPSGNHPVLGTTAIGTGAWHHAAASYDGTTWKLYLDGVEEASLAVGQPVASASNVAVALASALNSTNVAAGFFDGVVDEVRIWSVARTQAQIQSTANAQITSAQAGLVARWSLDEGTGTAINGSAGTTANGTITGASYAWVAPAPFNLSFLPPAAPEDFSASTISNTQIDLSWTDAATNETGFEIERSTTGIGGTYSLLVAIGANAISYSDQGLSPATEYCYRIRAVNGGGASTYAGPDCATTATAPTYALDFGGNTYASFGDPAALDLTQFTIEMWLRRDGAGVGTDTGTNGIPDAIPLLTKGRAEAEDPVKDINYFVGIKAATGVLCADFEEAVGGGTPSGNHPVLGTTAIGTGAWHHAAASYDGATWKLYLDGVEEASLAVGQPVASASNVAVALASALNSTNVAAGFFDGVVDEVRIWNVARTQAQIQSTANAQITSAQAGLVARWSLDEGTGTAINGSAGTTVNGTITGASYAWVAPAPFNLSFNQPPNSPTLIVPPHNATDVSTGPSLYVSASDPEAADLTITWHGRPVTANPGPDFTLIGIPDTQYYAGQLNGGTNAIFKSQTGWIAANRAARNIAYVATLGDCVEHGDAGDGVNPAIEWMRADTAYSYIESPAMTGLPEGIPYGVTVGNHDQQPIGNPDGTTTYYNQYFGVTRFQGRSYYGGHYGSNNDNWYDLFSASGMDFIVISFEYDTTPDQAILDWADQLLTTHSDRRAIAITHHMINTGNPGTFSTQGQAIYNALRDHSNLFLMLGGHVAGEGRRQDTFGGSTVSSLLSDYQSRTNGGNGWLRVMTFSPANNTIQVQTYTPWLDQFETDGDSQFTLTYPMSSASLFQTIGTASNVASGSSVAMVWSGLSPNTQYEWYATVNDGSVTTTGPTWAFTTSSTVGVDAMIPGEIALAPLRPNPSFGRVQVSFALPRATHARLSVFDLQGREVAVLADGILGAGHHPIVWDGTTAGGRLRSGLYLLRLQTPGRVEVRKLVWAQ